MNIRLPKVPTFKANENVKSFADAKKHKAADGVIKAVMNGAGRAQYLAENDNRGVYDDFPEAGIAGEMTDDDIEFVRFDTETGEVTEWGNQTTAGPSNHPTKVEFNFQKQENGFKFMRSINGKATEVTLSETGQLIDFTTGWND